MHRYLYRSYTRHSPFLESEIPGIFQHLLGKTEHYPHPAESRGITPGNSKHYSALMNVVTPDPDVLEQVLFEEQTFDSMPPVTYSTLVTVNRRLSFF